MKKLLKQILPPFVLSMFRWFFPVRRRTDALRRPVFSNTWFADTKANWEHLLQHYKPRRVLEIGSYEGASACHLIEVLAAQAELELHCVDTWEGGVEHRPGGFAESDMRTVESRFHHNTRLAMEVAPHRVSLVTHKALSYMALSSLVAQGKSNYFDMIYVDGSHQAPDVLFDALCAFRLLRIGGVLVFDDYLWREELPHGTDPLRCPKPAVDAFVNLFIRKLDVLNAPLGQLFVEKVAD